MSDKLKSYFAQRREAFAYLFFGVLTTAVNAVVYFSCRWYLDISAGASTNAAWVVSVVFAYATNKIWVFENKGVKNILREFLSFVAARLLSQAVNYIIIVAGVAMGLYEPFVYGAANVVVIIFNYFASKRFVFRK